MSDKKVSANGTKHVHQLLITSCKDRESGNGIGIHSVTYRIFCFRQKAFTSFALRYSTSAMLPCRDPPGTVLKPVPGSGSRAKCAQFRGSSDAKHVSSWFQPWATLWPTCHMLVPASLLQSVECSTECKNSIFHCTIGCNKYKSSLASGASPQTPPGGLFLPPGPPPPAWVHAAHRHGMVSPRKVWFQRPCSSLVLVPEEVVEPASGRYPGRFALIRYSTSVMPSCCHAVTLLAGLL